MRVVFRLRDGLTVYALGLPVGLLAYLLFVNALSYFIFVPITVWIVNIGVWVTVFMALRRGVPPLEWDISSTLRTRLALAGVAVFL
ncbi:hypothetical protein HC776_02375, partial [bacterium]|nr:hypothetical protein [bacterium]